MSSIEQTRNNLLFLHPSSFCTEPQLRLASSSQGLAASIVCSVHDYCILGYYCLLWINKLSPGLEHQCLRLTAEDHSLG